MPATTIYAVWPDSSIYTQTHTSVDDYFRDTLIETVGRKGIDWDWQWVMD